MGNFKKGDYLVSNECVYGGREVGEIVQLIEDQEENMVCFLNSNSSKRYNANIFNKSFRKATPEEVQFYMEDGRGSNIKDIYKSFDSNSKFKRGDTIVVRGDMKSGITFGTHHFPKNMPYIPFEKLTVKRVNKRREYIPLERDYLKLQEDMIDFELSQEANKKLSVFPTSGWCQDYDEDILKFLGEKAKRNILAECNKKDKCGVAWTHYAGKFGNDSWNVWPIIGKSIKPEYTKEQLRKLVPIKATCVELTNSPWALGTHSHVIGIDPIGSGKTVNLERSWLDYNELGEFYSRNAIFRELEEQKTNDRRKFAAEHFQNVWLHDDRITSMGMSMMAGIGKSKTVKKDKFTQQEVILLKRKKKNRKLIVF